MPRRRTLTGRKERDQNRLLMRQVRNQEGERQKRARVAELNLYRENSIFLECAINFETAQKNFELKQCNLCHRRWFDLNIDNNRLCTFCHKFQVKNELNIFSIENNMDPGPQPDVLNKLTFLEEQLIAQVHPVITVYRLKGGQFGYSGQVINFHQDITEFVTSLPHSIDTISKYIFVRKNDGEEYKDFIVNRDNVKAALIYLKNNNPWYRDITINENNLQCLPVNDSIFQQILLSQERQHISFNLGSLDEDDDQNILYDNVYESGAPTVTFQCNRKAVNSVLNIQKQNDESCVLPWPKLQSVPINEFTCDGYICRAFPTLFPTGRGDLRDTRICKVSNSDYFKFLMMYDDGRFAKHPRFRFFAFNSMMRWTALQNGSICIKKNSKLNKIESIEQLRDVLLKEPILYKSILSYNANLRSSSSYWYARSRELVDMVEGLGSPTIFMTLSAADLYWPELYRILDPDYNYANLNQNTEFVRKSKLLNSNPMIVSYFFHKRLNYFMDHFVKKIFKVKDFWFRIEFQHRGSPHMHGLFWFENAPDLKNLQPDDITRIQEIINYFDEFISTWHPDPSQTYDKHPSKLHFSEVPDENIDYNHLIRAVQMHKCSKAYCQRRKKNSSETICRFKYPKECVNESKIQFVRDNEVEFISKRNNPYLNSHSPQILKIWRANVDSQAIVSIHAVLSYIAKYASKAEPKSDGMKEFIRQTVQESNNNSHVQHIIQKILVKMCAERDYSAQEIFWIIMGWPLYRSSRQFVSINLEPSETWEHLNMNKEGGSISVLNSLEKYKQRPAKFEQMTLSDFFSKTYKKGATYNMRRIPFILRVIPKVKYDPNCIDNEKFYKQQVLLHVPWRQLIDLNPDNDTWKILYERYFKNNNDVFSSELDQLLHNFEDEEDYEEIDQVKIEQQDDWMEVAAGTKNVNQEIDLGRREIDIRYQWHTISSKEELNSLEKFIENEKIARNQRNSVISNQNYLQDVDFSDEQKEVINLFETQLRYLQGYEKEQPIKRIVVQGKAGSGKSTLINYLTFRLNQILGHSSYQLLAPTGAAAVNINGSTIHSKLLLGINKVFKDLSLHSLAQFQEEMYGCKFIFIDELSMIGCSLLRKIDLRLRKAFPSRQDEPFGGLFVYFFGDINQLPPVNDRPLYSDKTEGNEFLLEGKLLYTSSIQKFIFLSSSFRQNESQQVFRDILDRISNGECTVEDYKKLMTRSIQTLPLNERILFKDAVRLFATNSDVKEFNNQKLKELRQPVAYIPAYHNCSKAKLASAELLGGLEPFIILSIGSKVMLRSNLWVENGLVNGALGYVEDIIYEENHNPPDQMPRVIMVRFENNCPSTYVNSGCVPIPPITKFWKSGNINCSRKQFPLQLAFAITIHKSQGLTLDKAVVDIGTKETSIGLTYVAFSRVKTFEGLAIYRRFPFDRLSSIKNSYMLKCRKKEEIRMKNLINANQCL